MDIERVRQRAKEERLGVGETLTREEVIQLVFHPGFSSKEQVDEISGRGVGLDVVKSTIEKMGGKVFLTTKESSETRFVIQLEEGIGYARTG